MGDGEQGAELEERRGGNPAALTDHPAVEPVEGVHPRSERSRRLRQRSDSRSGESCTCQSYTPRSDRRGGAAGVRVLLQAVACGIGGIGVLQRRGEQRHPRTHWRTGHLQEHVLPVSATAGTAPLLLCENRQHRTEQGRPSAAHAQHVRVPGGARCHVEQGTEPAQGHGHHASHTGPSRLRPELREPGACGQYVRHGQQRELPQRPHRLASLASLPGGSYRRPSLVRHRLLQTLRAGLLPLWLFLPLLVHARRDHPPERA